MCQVYYYLIGLSIVRFEGKEDMVDEQITIDLACLEPKERELKQNQTKSHLNSGLL